MRITHLDGLRGIAALQVVIFHSNILSGVRILDASNAVILFFVLSGYCLALPYGRALGLAEMPGFYVRRFFRLYPAFFVCMFFTLACAAMFRPDGVADTYLHANNGFRIPSLPEFLKHLTLIYPGDSFDKFDPPVWSLVLEAKMSLVFPILIWLAYRAGPAVVVLALTVAAGFLLPSTTLVMISTFWLGIVISVYRNRLKVRAVPMLLLGLCFYFLPNLLLLGQFKSPEIYKIYVVAVAIGAALMILATETSPALHRSLSGPVVQFLGRISYSLYLFHFPIFLVLVSWLGSGLPIALIGIALSLIVGASFDALVERPGMRLGRAVAENLLSRSSPTRTVDSTK